MKSKKSAKQPIEDNQQPDAIVYLESQHREVEKLFKEIDTLGERAFKKRREIFDTIAQKLSHHAKIEEVLFYPEGKQVDKDLTLEAYEEHDVIKHMIAKIRRTEADDETFMAKVTVLKEVVEHHVKEEEEDYFPKARRKFGRAHLQELGGELKAKFDKLEARAKA